MALDRIAFIGNYLPRQCGIATFTTDLCRSLSSKFEGTNCFAVAINDSPAGYHYPPEVRFEIDKQELLSYQQAADFLNVTNVDVVCLQHEYGIFGGPAGSHIVALLRELRMPVVTTLHTVLREPDANQRKVLEMVAQFSDRLIVMSERAVEFLQEVYRVPQSKIDFIPHGIPDVPFVDPNFYKDQFGVEGKFVLLTFGLLSSNKGIEYVIEALPKIVNRYPNVVYIVLGATHPEIRKREGESYRLSLQRLAREKGVDQHVIFHNRFVTLEELVEFIGAADVYLTPYLNPAQIVSGTLAYTVGAGKAVVSTPYYYAEELLADGRGLIVPFKDSEAIAERVIDLLSNEADRHAMRKRAYTYAREMIWPRVAEQYMASLQRARQERRRRPAVTFSINTYARNHQDLPGLKLDHLHRLTDDTGLLQHATGTVPNYHEGYTTDDNARALILTVLIEELKQQMSVEVGDLASRYLAFLWYAFDEKTGRFRNFLSYDRRWLDAVGSEDSHGRALWALGVVLGRSQDEGLRTTANRLFEQALPGVLDFSSPRAWAFAIFAAYEYLKRLPGDRAARGVLETLGERLMALYETCSAPDWPWFEDALAYVNATLPHALLLCGQQLARADMVNVGLESLRWLARIQTNEGRHFAPVGNQGFFPRGGQKARFDQQPVEACAMVSACLEAQRVTGDDRWYDEAQRAFEWFLGRNDLRLPLYDSATGGCHDGLQPDRVNMNQGAESTVCFLLSLVEVSLSKHVLKSAQVGDSTSERYMPQPAAPQAIPVSGGGPGNGGM